MRNQAKLFTRLGLCLAFALHCLPVLAQNNAWTGIAGTTNWSDPGNWSFGTTPQTWETVEFTNAYPAVPVGVVDNIVDASFQIYSALYSTTSTNGFHTTYIDPGVKLQIDSFDTVNPTIYLGYGAPLNTEDLRWNIAGPGTLTVTNPLGYMNIVQGGQSQDHLAILDLSGLTNFYASLSQVFVAVQTNTAPGIRPMGTFYLAETNFITTAAATDKPGIMVGAYPTGDTNRRGTQRMYLGHHNVINSDAISMGGHKMTGTIEMRPGLTGGYVSLRGSAGPSDPVKILTIGDQRAGYLYDRGGSSAANSGTLDITGSWLDALVTDLYVSRSSTSSSSTTTGTLTYDQGTITADNAYIAFHLDGMASTITANANGTANVNGTAVLNVNNDLLMGRKLGSSTPSATLNVESGATVNIKGNIVNGGGNNTLNIDGLLDLQPAGDATPGTVTASTLSGSGTIADASDVTATESVSPATVATTGKLTVGNNLTLAPNATYTYSADSTTALTANDLVSVQGNLTLNSNTVSLVPIGGGVATGSYRLFEFTGSLSGFLSLDNPTRYAVNLSYGANTIDMTVSGGAPASLKWSSVDNSAWDTAATNWLNGASADRFFQSDTVLIDTSVPNTNFLALTGNLYPNTVTVNSSSADYTLGGSGRLGGTASIVKQGTSMLTISGGHDYTGPVTVSGGILQLGNNASLGTTNSGTTIEAGATLDIASASLYSPGETITIAGTGYNDGGAIINSGADEQNAIRFLTLSGDASIRSDNRFDVRGPGGNSATSQYPFSGKLDLNGYKLTKYGLDQMSIVDSIVTNAGSIELAEGLMALTRSIIDGPGSIFANTNTTIYIENSITGHIAKPMTFVGGTLRVTGGAFRLASPLTNFSSLNIDATTDLTITNTIVGGGPMIKLNSGNLIFEGPKTYTGPTIISGGALVLTNGASIASTPEIAVGAGARFDVSGLPGGLTLASGQVLSGSGSVIGDVAAGSGSGLVPGTSAGTLTFSNNLALNGGTESLFELSGDPLTIGGDVNDLVSVAGNLTLSGVNNLKILPLAGLNSGSPYTLFQYSGLSGGLANLSISSDSPRYTFTIIDPLTTPGSIQITASGTPVNLVWKGGAPANPNRWDTEVTPNWLNGVTPEVFYTGDGVTFNDTATTGNVSLFGTLQPAGVTFNNSSSLAYTLGGAGTLVAGSLTKSGSGSVVINNTSENTIAAATTVNAGTLSIENALTTTFGGVATVNGGAFNLVAGTNKFLAGAVVEGGSMNILTPEPIELSQPLLVNGGSVVFNQPVDITFGTIIADDGVLPSGTVQKSGANTLRLTGNNTNFSGPVVVSAGTLQVGQTYALGNTNAGTTVASGATLDVNGASFNNPGDIITISGNGVAGQGAIINSGAQQQNAIRGIQLAANASIGAPTNRWDLRGPGEAGTYNGLLDLNNFTLNKLGAGRISLVQADVLSAGTFNLYEGELWLTRCQIDGIGSINIFTNTLAFENYSTGYCAKAISVAGGTIRNVGSTLAITSPINNSGMTVDNTAVLSLQGTISGTGGLTKLGSSRLDLDVPNTFQGPITINGNILRLNNADAAGTSGQIEIINNTVTDTTGVGVELGAYVATPTDLALTVYTTNSPNRRGILRSTGFGCQWNGPIIPVGDGRVNLTANPATELNIYGPLTNRDFAGTVFLRGASDGTGHLYGQIDLGAGNLVKTDTSTWTIHTNGHNWALSTVAVGIVKLEANDALCPTAPLVMGQGGNNTASLDLNGFNQTVAGLSSLGDAASTLRIGNDSFFTDSLLTVAGTNVTSYRGQLVDTLTEFNPYKLALTVASGALYLNSPSNTYTLPTTVQSGATLGGSGLLVSPVIVQSGGTLAPGAANAVGTLTISNNLTFQAGSTNLAQLNPATLASDAVIGVTNVTYGGTLVLTNVSASLYPADSTFKLFDAETYSGSFAAIVPATPSPSQTWDTSMLAVNGTIKVLGSPVSTTPTNMTFAVTGNTLEIGWPDSYTGWLLESQTNSLSVGLSNNWFPVPGSTTTNKVFIPIDTTKGTVYFRLTYTP